MEDRSSEFEDKNLEMIQTEGERQLRSLKKKTFYKNYATLLGRKELYYWYPSRRRMEEGRRKFILKKQ